MAGWTVQENVRVSDAATRLAHGYDGQTWLWVTYDLGGWGARVRCRAVAPFDGPEEVSITLDMSDEGVDAAVDLAAASGGVTSEVLRSVPLGDARKVLRRLRTEVLSQRDAKDAQVYDLPERMKSTDDWGRFARAYERSVLRNPLQPMVHLAAATGLSPNTLSARVRRAQELGLIVGAPKIIGAM